MSPSDVIQISLVVAAWNDLESLGRCLDSINNQTNREETEVIVVSNYATAGIEQGYPQTRFITLPPHTSVPKLRTEGLRQSRGEIVALLEDHGYLDSQWCEEIRRGYQSPHPVIGGALENDPDSRIVDWAVFFYDYGKYLPPNVEDYVPTLAGNNVSYRRTVLDEVAPTFQEGFYEVFVHQALLEKGLRLRLAPNAVVHHRKRYRVALLLPQFHHHARSFAGRRAATLSQAHRLALAVGCAVLPFLLTARIASRVWKKGRHRQKLALSLPWVFVLMTSWTSGEVLGYLLGEGASAQHWN